MDKSHTPLLSNHDLYVFDILIRLYYFSQILSGHFYLYMFTSQFSGPLFLTGFTMILYNSQSFFYLHSVPKRGTPRTSHQTLYLEDTSLHVPCRLLVRVSVYSLHPLFSPSSLSSPEKASIPTVLFGVSVCVTIKKTINSEDLKSQLRNKRKEGMVQWSQKDRFSVQPELGSDYQRIKVYYLQNQSVSCDRSRRITHVCHHL